MFNIEDASWHTQHLVAYWQLWNFKVRPFYIQDVTPHLQVLLETCELNSRNELEIPNSIVEKKVF